MRSIPNQFYTIVGGHMVNHPRSRTLITRGMVAIVELRLSADEKIYER